MDGKQLVCAALTLALLLPSLSIPREVVAVEALTISSPAFAAGGYIPAKYTCDGEDVNPPLRLAAVPPRTKSLALIVDDPDAPVGTWVHWVVWNIPPETTEIPENSLPAGAVQGINDFRRPRYGGPCPPSGAHRYFFKVYALDTLLGLDAGATRAQLESAIRGHVIGQGEIVGLYRRQ